MQAMSIKPIFTPANCTDCVSPVDSHVAQTLKMKIGQRYDAAYMRNTEEWELPAKQGGLTAMKKRMMVAVWATEAWQELIEKNQKLIRGAFIRTGFLLAKDGSENHKIELWPVKKRSGQERQWSSTGPMGEVYNFD